MYAAAFSPIIMDGAAVLLDVTLKKNSNIFLLLCSHASQNAEKFQRIDLALRLHKDRRYRNNEIKPEESTTDMN